MCALKMSNSKSIVCCLSMTLAFVIGSSFLLTSTQAAVFTQHALIHPAYPGKCFDSFSRKPMIPGKEYKPKGICAALTCDLQTQTINIETCPDIEMPECEEIAVDPSWSFPKCCPQFKCTDFKTGKQVIITL